MLETSAPEMHGISVGQILYIARIANAARLFGRGTLERSVHRACSVVSSITVGGIIVCLDAPPEISDDPE